MSLTGVVRDPAGRVSALKLVTLLLVLWPGVSLALDWWMQNLGPRPVTEVIHGTGLWAIRFLVITLAVTPVRGVLDWPRVVQLRPGLPSCLLFPGIRPKAMTGALNEHILKRRTSH